MKLSLVRKVKTGKSTIGELSIDGKFFYYTLELPWRDNKEDISCIPLGIFTVELRWSPRFERKVPWILNVPERKDAEIHIGNFPSNTHGCVLVGLRKGVDYIEDSTKAFVSLMVQLTAATLRKEEITLEITEE